MNYSICLIDSRTGIASTFMTSLPTPRVGDTVVVRMPTGFELEQKTVTGTACEVIIDYVHNEVTVRLRNVR